MPSPLELLEGTDPIPGPGPPPAEMLHTVKAGGRRRRTGRHRRNVGLVVLAAGLLAVPTATLWPGQEEPGQDLAVAAGGVPMPETLPPESVLQAGPTDTAAAVDPQPTVPAVEAPPTTVPPVSVAPSPTAPPRRATSTAPTPAPACRNSEAPTCGPFRWDPDPTPNQPLVASFTRAPTTAVAGETVVFEVTWSDADAQLTQDRLSTDGTVIGTACALGPRYGPWSPPARTGGSGTLPYATTFPAAGTYSVAVALGTASCGSPYGNDALVQTTITVTEAQAG